MKKDEWQKALIFLQKHLQSLEDEEHITRIYILIILIENFLHDAPSTCNFSDFKKYAKTVSISTLFPDMKLDYETIEKILNPLSFCLQLIQECVTPKKPLRKSASLPWFFAPKKTYYLLNAKSIVTILTKSDAEELQRVFANPLNIFKMQRTSDDIFPVLRSILPIEEQGLIYEALYHTEHFTPDFTKLQAYIAYLHAYEFSKLTDNHVCRKYYRFLLLMDKILEKRKKIDIPTRKILVIHTINALLLESACFHTKPYLTELRDGLQYSLSALSQKKL